MAVTHFALNFSLWNKSGNGVDYDNINRTASDKCLCNFKSVFTRVGL